MIGSVQPGNGSFILIHDHYWPWIFLPSAPLFPCPPAPAPAKLFFYSDNIIGPELVARKQSWKHRENHKMLPREHLIGCPGVKMFLLKDPFKVFFIHNLRCHISSFVTCWFFLLFCHNLSSWVWSQFEFCHIDFFSFIFKILWQQDFNRNLCLVTT